MRNFYLCWVSNWVLEFSKQQFKEKPVFGTGCYNGKHYVRFDEIVPKKKKTIGKMAINFLLLIVAPVRQLLDLLPG
jgi:hypothetical protein